MATAINPATMLRFNPHFSLPEDARLPDWQLIINHQATTLARDDFFDWYAQWADQQAYETARQHRRINDYIGYQVWVAENGEGGYGYSTVEPRHALDACFDRFQEQPLPLNDLIESLFVQLFFGD